MDSKIHGLMQWQWAVYWFDLRKKDGTCDYEINQKLKANLSKRRNNFENQLNSLELWKRIKISESQKNEVNYYEAENLSDCDAPLLWAKTIEELKIEIDEYCLEH